jgi:predicted SAM-dependent methyltransferase
MKYINLGCGNRFHEDWVNVDFASNDARVKNVNLLSGIPYEDNTFDVAYHSHVLEHFAPEDGKSFLKECFRILKPGGVLRVAIPDLEVIARNYIKYLDAAMEGDRDADANYNWTLIEMYDQVVRHQSGGEFQKYIYQKEIPNEDFIYERNGYEARKQRKNYFNSLSPDMSFKSRAFRFLLKIQSKLEDNIPFYRYYRVGRLRLNGEVHLKMYDQYSLSRVLKEVGFIDPGKTSGYESKIPNWEKYMILDIDNGKVRKPDSLFLEAVKPMGDL